MPTDLTFPTAQGRFNDRVCGLFIQDNRLLAMHDERSPYDYLPGGRVALHEPAEAAILREVQEEVGLRLSGQEARLITTQVRTLVEGKRINDLVDVYGFDYDGPVDLAQATTDEVAQVRWMDPREIAALFDAGQMVRGIKDLSYFMEMLA